MKYYRVIGIVCVWIFFIGQIFAQSVPDNECLQLVASNDSDDVLKEMVIYPPVFCAMHDGKRLKMKISNEGEKVMRKTYFYLFYKKKRICRIHLPNMKKGGGRAVISFPSNRTWPLSGVSNPPIMRTSTGTSVGFSRPLTCANSPVSEST